MIDWLCWALRTCQPLWVILCHLPEKPRREIAEEMKERDGRKRKMHESEETAETRNVSIWQRCPHPEPSSPTCRHFAKNEVEKMAITLNRTQGSRYRSPLSPFAQKNKIWHKKIINWRKQVAKKISPELPTTESYNCRACLSHLDCIIRQLATQLSIRKR